jgi:hypothetical protein
VGKANKIKSMMGAVKQAITQNQTQRGPYDAQQQAGIAQRLTSRATPTNQSSDEKLALSGLLQQAKDELSAAKTAQDQKIAQEKIDLLQQKLDNAQTDFDTKLARQQKDFEQRQAQQKTEFMQKLDEQRYAENLRANTAREVAVLRAQAQRDLKEMPTTQSRSMGEMATALRTEIPRIKQEVSQLDSEGKLGIIAGRYDDFMTGNVGANDPEFTQLRTDMSLMTSGTLRAHFGARGGQLMYDKFKAYFNQAGQSAANLNAALDTVDNWMGVYEEMGKGQLPGQGGGNAPAASSSGGAVIKYDANGNRVQ